MRLRQVTLVAGELEPALSRLEALLGVRVALRDPRCLRFGIANGVLPVGEEFIEVITPLNEAATAARYMARRGGGGGYMLIFQAADPGDFEAHLEAQGVRLVSRYEPEGYGVIHYQLHPRDTGGTYLAVEIASRAQDPAAWDCAGEDWREAVDVSVVRGVSGASIQSADPGALARRWSQILRLPVIPDASGNPCLPLTGGPLRFVTDQDGRGEGLSEMEIIVTDRALLAVRADALGLDIDAGPVDIFGLRCTFR